MGVEPTDDLVTGRRAASPGPLGEPGLEPGGDPSLIADLDAFLKDSKTYLEAEVGYQKSRVIFSARRLKWALIYGAAAFGFLHLALIALVVGVVMALTPITGPWVAILIVVGLLGAGALVLIQRLRGRLRDVRSVFEEGHP